MKYNLEKMSELLGELEAYSKKVPDDSDTSILSLAQPVYKQLQEAAKEYSDLYDSTPDNSPHLALLDDLGFLTADVVYYLDQNLGSYAVSDLRKVIEKLRLYELSQDFMKSNSPAYDVGEPVFYAFKNNYFVGVIEQIDLISDPRTSSKTEFVYTYYMEEFSAPILEENIVGIRPEKRSEYADMSDMQISDATIAQDGVQK